MEPGTSQGFPTSVQRSPNVLPGALVHEALSTSSGYAAFFSVPALANLVADAPDAVRWPWPFRQGRGARQTAIVIIHKVVRNSILTVTASLKTEYNFEF